MTRFAFDPVERLLELQEELDRFFGKPLFDFSLSGANVFPAINVFTDDDGYVVRAEVPGIKADQLQVQIEAGRLSISGERPAPSDANGEASLHRRERRFGRFSRTIQLPADADPDQATAECRHGVLTVRVPKHAAAKPRSIAVQAA